MRLPACDPLRGAAAVGRDAGHQGARDSEDRRASHGSVPLPVLRRLCAARRYLHLPRGASQGHRQGTADVSSCAAEYPWLTSELVAALRILGS